MIKKIITDFLAFFGFKIIRIGKEKERLLYEFSQAGALFRSVKRNLKINSVIDVGGSDGQWSRMCRKFFPESNYLLVEAQKEHENKLIEFCSSNTRTKYIIAAAGNTDGQIYFDNSSLFGGLASPVPFAKNNIVVDCRKIDSLVKQFVLEPPYLIKLDTHGYEIPILEGSKEVLKDANLVIIEAYNFLIAEGSVRFYELCRYMETKGFLPIDAVELTHRKKDNSLWQMDIYFIKSDRVEFADNQYQ